MMTFDEIERETGVLNHKMYELGYRDGKEWGVSYGKAESEKRIEKAIPAIDNMIFLHTCEQEGMSSGKPSFDEWMKAYDDLCKALSILKGEEG